MKQAFPNTGNPGESIMWSPALMNKGTMAECMGIEPNITVCAYNLVHVVKNHIRTNPACFHCDIHSKNSIKYWPEIIHSIVEIASANPLLPSSYLK
jgi:hypothetical protein